MASSPPKTNCLFTGFLAPQFGPPASFHSALALANDACVILSEKYLFDSYNAFADGLTGGREVRGNLLEGRCGLKVFELNPFGGHYLDVSGLSSVPKRSFSFDARVRLGEQARETYARNICLPGFAIKAVENSANMVLEWVGFRPGYSVVPREEVGSALDASQAMFPDWNWARIGEQMEYAKVVLFGGKAVFSTLSPPFPSEAARHYAEAGQSHPAITSFSVTNRCAGSCTYCSNAERERGDDLSLAQAKKILAGLQALKVPVVNITGGEPLLRDDLEELVASVDANKVAITLATSGFTPKGPLSFERAKALKDAGLTYFVASLDHYIRGKNDRLRFQGAYDAAIHSIESALAAGLFTSTNIVVTGENFGDLEEYIRQISKLGVHGIRIADVIPSGKSLDRPPLSLAEKASIVEMHKRLVHDDGIAQLTTVTHFEGPETARCRAGGISHMYIDASGGLRPCDFVPIVYGDLTRESLDVAYGRMRRLFHVPDGRCVMHSFGAYIGQVLNGRPFASYEEFPELVPDR